MRSDSVIRVFALMEATSVTGPAKNLINFCKWTRTPEAAALGFDVAVSVATFCRPPDDGSRNAFVLALQAANIPVHVIREQRRFDPGVLSQLTALIGEIQPQIVQTHNVKSHFLLKLAGLRKKVAWLAFQHGYTAKDLKDRLYNQLDRWSLRSADRVISVCGAFVPRLVQYGVHAGQVRILHNSVQPARLIPDSDKTQLRSKLGVTEREKIILAIGRLSEEKGHADLIEALGYLNHSAPDAAWKAVIVGNGPELKNLERLVTKLALERRVIFAGFMESVASFYSIADILALPSHTEGSPNVLLEAMAAQVPVAATLAGGIPEIVDHEKTALLVPTRQPEALSEALRRLLENENLRKRLAMAAYERACTDFSPARYMHRLAGIYRDALDIPPPLCKSLS